MEIDPITRIWTLHSGAPESEGPPANLCVAQFIAESGRNADVIAMRALSSMGVSAADDETFVRVLRTLPSDSIMTAVTAARTPRDICARLFRVWDACQLTTAHVVAGLASSGVPRALRALAQTLIERGSYSQFLEVIAGSDFKPDTAFVASLTRAVEAVPCPDTLLVALAVVAGPKALGEEFVFLQTLAQQVSKSSHVVDVATMESTFFAALTFADPAVLAASHATVDAVYLMLVASAPDPNDRHVVYNALARRPPAPLTSLPTSRGATLRNVPAAMRCAVQRIAETSDIKNTTDYVITSLKDGGAYFQECVAIAVADVFSSSSSSAKIGDLVVVLHDVQLLRIDFFLQMLTNVVCAAAATHPLTTGIPPRLASVLVTLRQLCMSCGSDLRDINEGDRSATLTVGPLALLTLRHIQFVPKSAKVLRAALVAVLRDRHPLTYLDLCVGLGRLLSTLAPFTDFSDEQIILPPADSIFRSDEVRLLFNAVLNITATAPLREALSEDVAAAVKDLPRPIAEAILRVFTVRVVGSCDFWQCDLNDVAVGVIEYNRIIDRAAGDFKGVLKLELSDRKERMANFDAAAKAAPPFQNFAGLFKTSIVRRIMMSMSDALFTYHYVKERVSLTDYAGVSLAAAPELMEGITPSEARNVALYTRRVVEGLLGGLCVGNTVTDMTSAFVTACAGNFEAGSHVSILNTAHLVRELRETLFHPKNEHQYAEEIRRAVIKRLTAIGNNGAQPSTKATLKTVVVVLDNAAKPRDVVKEFAYREERVVKDPYLTTAVVVVVPVPTPTVAALPVVEESPASSAKKINETVVVTAAGDRVTLLVPKKEESKEDDRKRERDDGGRRGDDRDSRRDRDRDRKDDRKDDRKERKLSPRKEDRKDKDDRKDNDRRGDDDRRRRPSGR